MFFDKKIFIKLVNEMDRNMEVIFSNLGYEQGKLPMVLGKFNQELMGNFQKNYSMALQNSLGESYIILDHSDESGQKFQLRLHKRNTYRYGGFPALVCDKFPNYNAQCIYEKATSQLVAMEGPHSEDGAKRMLRDLCKNKSEIIYAFGEFNEMSSHFNYYCHSEELKLSSTFLIQSSVEKSINKCINSYKLKCIDNKENFEILVRNFAVSDGDVIDFLSLEEVQQIYQEMKTNKIAVHCSAGKGRTSILTLAFVVSEEGVFESENFLDNFTQCLLTICKKRTALCPNRKQMMQIYAYGLAFTAFKNNIEFSEFPENFFKLDVAPRNQVNKIDGVSESKSCNDENTQNISKFIAQSRKYGRIASPPKIDDLKHVLNCDFGYSANK